MKKLRKTDAVDCNKLAQITSRFIGEYTFPGVKPWNFAL